MKKIEDFLKIHKYAVIWTVCYILIIYLILKLLFGFDLLSASQWSVLIRAQLRGFGGFVFGILILAAVPMYVASMMVIVRTKKPLFNLIAPKPPITVPVEKKTDTDLPDMNFSPEIPRELRGAFIRARQSINDKIPKTTDTTPIISAAPIAELPNQSQDIGLPLPDNFDFDMDDNNDAMDKPDAPVFREITFGAPKQETISESQNPAHSELNKSSENELKKYLENKKYTESDGIITYNNMSIAVHDDLDFWIADDTSWFATGKQIPSPISKLLAVIGENKTSPVLYLGATNIMDLDKNISKWESAGIRVITNLDDL